MVGSSMSKEVYEVVEQISKEKDHEKLIELTQHLGDVLDAEEAKLVAEGIKKSPHSES